MNAVPHVLRRERGPGCGGSCSIARQLLRRLGFWQAAMARAAVINRVSFIDASGQDRERGRP
jgi:hypothetical protein